MILNINKVVYFILLLLFLFTNALISQSIEVTSFANNPVEVNPLIGGSLTINYEYTSEVGSTGNHIYITLELLDGSNAYHSTIAEITLENQTPGTNVAGSVEFFIGSSNTLSTDLTGGIYYQVKTILYASGGWTGNAWSGYWNTPSITLQDTSGITLSSNAISKGVDVSYMSEMEADGFVWKDNNGNTKNLMPLLKEYQINTIRLRVWVDPSISGANGWCDIADMVTKAKLAHAEGMDIMVCIHYSDYWADPGKQDKPAAWTSMSVSELETAIYDHTTNILTALDSEGITPKWVQVGNETNDGMLWTTGKASSSGFVNYAKFINAGNNAIKTFDSNIKSIVHISNGNNNNLFIWNIGGLIANGAQFDIIAMSLYPDENDWVSKVDDTYANMLDMKSRYGKDVMMAEVGFSSGASDISHQFLVYMIEKTRQAGGLGVLYWEPIIHLNWTPYSKGAWDSDSSPSVAMDAFIDNSTLSDSDFNADDTLSKGLVIYPNPVSERLTVDVINKNITSINIFDTIGRKLKTINDIKNHKFINLSSLPNGLYFIAANTGEVIKVIKN
ncbi:glycosyl hydrolase 53 family protein [Polaribacter sp.]|nr:glycosyl hydrolase 53 family protein [Polaribacter sp.]